MSDLDLGAIQSRVDQGWQTDDDIAQCFDDRRWLLAEARRAREQTEAREDYARIIADMRVDLAKAEAQRNELAARVKELEEEANEPQIGSLRWVEREMALERAEKEALVVTAAREIVAQRLRLHPAIDCQDKLADAVAKLDGKEGT